MDIIIYYWWCELTCNLQGVEPERCPSFSNALKHNKPIYTNTTASIADGLLVPTVGVNAFATGGKVEKILKGSWIQSYHLHLQ